MVTEQAPITVDYSSSVQYARNIMRLFLDETHTLAVLRSDMLLVRTFGFLHRRLLVPRAVGRSTVMM